MKADLPVIEVKNVAKRYGSVHALRDVSLTLPQGSQVALVGHNGAGKTTLMKLILGLVRPSSGTLRVLGADPADGGVTARQGMGWLPENVSFNPALTGREILRFFARLKGEPVSAANVLLEKVGLADAARRAIGGYSKGMRQRLGLAQAMLGSPRVLLLDEPTNGLDPAARQAMYDMFASLASSGTTVLLSSHALDELEGRVERVVILNRGEVLADGDVSELRRLTMLPVRIRLTLAKDSIPAWVRDARRIGPRLIEVVSPQRDKMELLRRAATDPSVADMEVVQPNLDEIYSRFLRDHAEGVP